MSYQELIKELSFARNVVAITGAGVSAESGNKFNMLVQEND